MPAGKSLGIETQTLRFMKKIFALHGWTYSTASWKPFIKHLENNGIQLVMLDIPGLTEESGVVWTLNDYVEWLKVKLNKEKTPVILGHSNGGRIALAYAAKYPQNLKKIILLDSAGISHNEPRIRLKRLAFSALAKIGKRFRASNLFRDLLYKAAREQDYHKATPEMKQTMINLLNTDLTPQLPEIKIPVTIIWGRYDKTTPLSDGRLMHRLIKNSELFIIDNARHSPHFTHPDRVSMMIRTDL